jgi:hypothetical protein
MAPTGKKRTLFCGLKARFLPDTIVYTTLPFDPPSYGGNLRLVRSDRCARQVELLGKQIQPIASPE